MNSIPGSLDVVCAQFILAFIPFSYLEKCNVMKPIMSPSVIWPWW